MLASFGPTPSKARNRLATAAPLLPLAQMREASPPYLSPMCRTAAGSHLPTWIVALRFRPARPHRGSTPNPRRAAPQAGHRPPSAPSRTWPHSPHVRCCRVRRPIAARASTVSSLVSASDWACVEGGRRRPLWGSMRTGTAGRIASRAPRRNPGTGRRMRRVKRWAQRSAAARVRCRVPHPSFTVSPGWPADGVQVHASTCGCFCRTSPSAIRRNQRNLAVIALSPCSRGSARPGAEGGASSARTRRLRRS